MCKRTNSLLVWKNSKGEFWASGMFGSIYKLDNVVESVLADKFIATKLKATELGLMTLG